MRMHDDMLEDDDDMIVPHDFSALDAALHAEEEEQDFFEEEDEDLEGELTVDLYRQGDALVLKAMTSGVRKDDLEIALTRESITIRGVRHDDSYVDKDAYYYQELYWGTFSRTLTLPEEIDVDQAKAKEEHGLLTIVLPLIDKERQAKLKVH
ncbi:MAG: Hsp20/alpha crystallin family protein [Candidatus Pacebacteria bacterium]|nr:Hsp20/alpha crystallin family protein [Candidatus Paceibacterota bacterium]